MTLAEPIARRAPAEIVPPSKGERGPVKRVSMLLPLWGTRYIRQFLQMGLPTWLAPGNIPAVAETLPSEIVFLTSEAGEIQLREHPTVARLASVVSVRYHNIDHLITGSNHSTTITLSYAEAVRSTKGAFDTCFFFLVSDFLIADGSLRNALQRVIDGADGVQAGNFQTTAEDASPWLMAQLKRHPDQLSLSPRAMLRWAFQYLHPVTIGNTVNFSDLHLRYGNRLFWRVDENTIIGRFYLIHMLCIRPEVIDFEIGSSCDYSFIQEMCPSGRVEYMTDSDEYLVIEMQPQFHESGGLYIGERPIRGLAKNLSQWTTAQHRKNAQTTLIFHSADLPPNLETVKRDADRYIRTVGRYMSQKPQDYRDHPYWRGAIASWREAKGLPLTPFEWRMMLGITHPLANPNSFIERVKEAALRITGRPPHVRLWHPRRADYDLIRRAVEASRPRGESSALLISDTTTPFTATMVPRKNVTRVGRTNFLTRSAEDTRKWLVKFDVILAEMHDWELRAAIPLIRRALPMLKPGGRLFISCIDPSGEVKTRDVANRIALIQSGVMWRAPQHTKLEFVPTSWLRTKVTRGFRQMGRWIRRAPLLTAPLALIQGPFLVLMGYLVNGTVKPVKRVKDTAGISSLLITVEASALNDDLLDDGITARDLAEARELASRQTQLDNTQVLQ
jgi:hypothetical protein